MKRMRTRLKKIISEKLYWEKIVSTYYAFDQMLESFFNNLVLGRAIELIHPTIFNMFIENNLRKPLVAIAVISVSYTHLTLPTILLV